MSQVQNLKQQIEDMFVKQPRPRRQEIPWSEIVALFKRATQDRVDLALQEMVSEGTLIEIDPGILIPPRYRLA